MFAVTLAAGVLVLRPMRAVAEPADTLNVPGIGTIPIAPVLDGMTVVASAAPMVVPPEPSTLAFTTRRVENPRYRPPSPAVPWARGAAVSRLRALSFLRAQITTFDAPSTPPTGVWELQAGEQYHDQDLVQGTVTGERTIRGSVVRQLRFDARRSALAMSAGDVPSVGF
jgi:hypothetical protein